MNAVRPLRTVPRICRVLDDYALSVVKTTVKTTLIVLALSLSLQGCFLDDLWSDRDDDFDRPPAVHRAPEQNPPTRNR